MLAYGEVGGLVKFLPAVAYLLCLGPARLCLAYLLDDVCRVEREGERERAWRARERMAEREEECHPAIREFSTNKSGDGYLS